MTTEPSDIRNDLLDHVRFLRGRSRLARVQDLLGRYGKKYTRDEIIRELGAMRDEGILRIVPSRDCGEIADQDLLDSSEVAEGRETAEDVDEWLRQHGLD